MNQKLAVRLLEKQGHSVIVAGNGRQAVDVLFGPSAVPCDAVLMDVQMPEMDGLEATTAIRERERICGGHIPIVAMTAHAMKGDQERCLAAGMDGYVSKPIKPEALFAILAELTAQPELKNAPTIQSVLNWGEALGHVRGDVELLRELSAIFLQEWPGWLTAIRDGVRGQDLDLVRRTAHTVKGTLGTFAATDLHAIAQELENFGARRRISNRYGVG